MKRELAPTVPPYADVRETHSGVVLLLGDVAYKLKKPIALPFLDFSTTAARREACEREVTLNRRLSPDVYLGVAVLEPPTGDPEPMVMMRRMPDVRRLSALLDAPDAIEHVRAIARLLAAFHGCARRSARIADAGSRDEVRRRWRANLREAEQLPGTPLPTDLIDAIRARSERYLAGRRALFDERLRQGGVLDGHGDLLADDIFCLQDGPRVLDCLDFDDRLRYLDQIDDVACLTMDLLRLGHAELAIQLVRRYTELTGDLPPDSLMHHYIAYRAFMRAKVTAVRQQEPLTHATSSEDPVELARLALDHLDTAAVRLILVGGPPGSGKSTLASELARRLSLCLVDSDSLRKELVGLSARTPAAAGFKEGIYSVDWSNRTYTQMLQRTRMLLERGESVLLDASWSSRHHRAAAAELARRTHADMVELRCDVPLEVAATRLRERQGTASDADERIAAAMRQAEDPWPGSVRIDTGQPLAGALDAAAEAVLARARRASLSQR